MNKIVLKAFTGVNQNNKLKIKSFFCEKERVYSKFTLMTYSLFIPNKEYMC